MQQPPHRTAKCFFQLNTAGGGFWQKKKAYGVAQAAPSLGPYLAKKD